MGVRFIFLFCLLMGTLTISAQVTVGLEEKSVPGVLMQLKTEPETSLDTNGNETAQKGLLLPRVFLITDATVYTASDTNDQKLLKSLGLSGVTTDAQKHIGLLIFNTQEATIHGEAANVFNENKICKGVYVWKGDKWERAMVEGCP